jgi:outer membrane protein assembly factor BamB
MQNRLILGTLVSAAFLVAAPPVDNWPQFRGPGSTGVADDPRLPDTWSETENVIWKTDIPGMGWSSPIIWGKRVFLTSAVSTGEIEKPKKGLYFGGERKKSDDEHRYVVYALDFDTGKVLWEKEAWKGIPPGPRHLKNSYASETPATDGERVYAYFGNVGLFTYDMDGKLLWSLPSKPVRTRFGWGTAASPVVYKGRLYVVNDNDDESYLVALDAKTGKVIWKVNRPDEKTNWSTPYIWEHDGKVEIVTTGTGKNRSYDLDGKLLWEFGGMSSIVIPVPFTANNLLYLASGYVGDQNRPVFVVKPGGKGTLTDENFAWKLPQAGPYNTSPLVYNGVYYTLLDRGFLTAHDAMNGKELYGKQRIDPAAGAFTASPWAANGKVFALSEDGDTFVFQAGPEYKLVGKNSLNEFCMSTPAIARGSLFIRTASKVYRIGKK